MEGFSISEMASQMGNVTALDPSAQPRSPGTWGAREPVYCVCSRRETCWWRARAVCRALCCHFLVCSFNPQNEDWSHCVVPSQSQANCSSEGSVRPRASGQEGTNPDPVFLALGCTPELSLREHVSWAPAGLCPQNREALQEAAGHPRAESRFPFKAMQPLGGGQGNLLGRKGCGGEVTRPVPPGEGLSAAPSS